MKVSSACSLDEQHAHVVSMAPGQQFLYNSLYFSYFDLMPSAPCMLSDNCCLQAFIHLLFMHTCMSLIAIACVLSCICYSYVFHASSPRHHTFVASVFINYIAGLLCTPSNELDCIFNRHCRL